MTLSQSDMTLSQHDRGVTQATGNEEGKGEFEEDTPYTRKMARRRSAQVMQRRSSLKVLQEWEAEKDVRDMYDITPPVSF